MILDAGRAASNSAGKHRRVGAHVGRRARGRAAAAVRGADEPCRAGGRRTVLEALGPSARGSTEPRVKARIDTRGYPLGASVTKKDMDALPITHDPVHGDWNCTRNPRQACGK